MKTLATLLALLLLSTAPADAKIWRVDSDPTHEADFRTLQDAEDGAASGDTLYVAGSTISYGNVNLNKRLYIFGPGYFLNQNPMTQAVPLSASVEDLDFSPGSSGSVVVGMFLSKRVNIKVDDITLRRNYISDHHDGALVYILGNVDRAVIVQNYIVNTAAGVSGYDTIRLSSPNTGVIIANNFIQCTNYGSGMRAIEMLGSPSGTLVFNNVIWGETRVSQAIFQNNILVEGTFSSSNSSVEHNIGNADQFAAFPAENDNQSNVDMGTVFVDPTGASTDGKWQIRDPGPAAGAGSDGEDVGMFGGASPYVLSGLPTIPAIYFFNASVTGSSSQGLPVQMSVKARN